MKILGIIDEDFVNYKFPSMTIEFPYCSLKCDKLSGRAVCQNSPLLSQEKIEIDVETIIKRYLANDITRAIVCQGLEPMDSFDDLCELIWILRYIYFCEDDVVIYTGYNEDEIENKIDVLKKFPNVIVKFGRFLPDQKKHYDETLGIYLASNNQYGKRIS